MTAAEPMATHGMLVVGEEVAYLSHLAMFMSPHDFQVLLAVTFTSDTGDAQKTYRDDRRVTGTDIYTLRPERFRLSDLMGAGGQSVRRSFTGTLFRGHFERGGTEIIDPVTVEVKNIIHFRQFEHHASRPADLTYIMFGSSRELYLAHFITTPPDFDQIISVKQVRSVSGAPLTDEVLRKGPGVAIPGTADAPGNRLQEGRQVAAAWLDDSSPGVDLRFVMGHEFYLETGDLAAGPHSH
ncbi:hypothetical protein [Streptomyces sp. NPDC005476]|uniref:hypothetical protein n=1 Tax=Streptomyces sp. NPDC005476 TaxID=3156882 RepID=UPI003456E955